MGSRHRPSTTNGAASLLDGRKRFGSRDHPLSTAPTGKRTSTLEHEVMNYLAQPRAEIVRPPGRTLQALHPRVLRHVFGGVRVADELPRERPRRHATAGRSDWSCGPSWPHRHESREG
jgi:hypothetical protein